MGEQKPRFARREALKTLGAISLGAFLPAPSSGEAGHRLVAGRRQEARLELIPPSLVTDKIVLEIRGAVENNSDADRDYKVSTYLDNESPASLVYSTKVSVPAHRSRGIYYRHPTAGWAGHHRLILFAASGAEQVRAEREIEVLKSDYRSTDTIGGAWVDLLHWSEAEARYCNAALRKLTCDDWRQQIRGMHSIGMDIVVIQEVFRNQAYYGTNTIATTGYRGEAFYRSALFPGRVQIACHDPLEAILSEADRLHMSVFPGVGMYAWFDYSAPSLEWHKKVATELWHRYGHHPSFYGWYISEEVGGSLISSQGDKAKERYRQEIITFFAEFQSFCRRFAPEKPVMLAPNTFGLRESQEVWPDVLKHVDIICPFAFGRMPKGDLSAQQAAHIWQMMCYETGTHLWMDMEAFVFQGKALVPGPIEGIVQSLHRFRNFEKIICYEYSGIFNSPESTLKPGGSPTVELYREYQRYLQRRGLGIQ